MPKPRSKRELENVLQLNERLGTERKVTDDRFKEERVISNQSYSHIMVQKILTWVLVVAVGAIIIASINTAFKNLFH